MKQGNRKQRLRFLPVLIFATVLMLGVTAFTAEAACSHSYQNGFCSRCGGYEAALDSNNDGLYEIGNAGKLYWFSEQVNGGNADANAILTADIDVNPGYGFDFETETGLVRVTRNGAVIGYLGTGHKGTVHFTGTASVPGAVYDTKYTAVSSGSAYNAIHAIRLWIPIGNSSTSYTGSFDGGNHTVSGLHFNDASTAYAGLFGGVYSGEVSNVTVVNTCLLGEKNVGGIAGYSCMSSITDCRFEGIVSADSHIGGVVGYAYASAVTQCSNSGTVVSSAYIAGGIAGEIAEYSSILNCYNTGAVGGGREKLGGIVGYNYGGSSVSNSYNTGTITGAYFVGGVIGCSASSTVTGCYYQMGCANDGNGYAQNGVGLDTKGSALADVQGCTTGMTGQQFASGQVAYELQREQTTQVWGQNLDNGAQVQLYPVLSNATVYSCYGCDAETLSFTNDLGITVKPHSWNEDGACATCGWKPVERWNITLADAIGIHFVMNTAQLETVVCYAGETQVDSSVVLHTDGTCTVSVFLAAAQMTEDVTLRVNGSFLPKAYSVRRYADVILAGDYSDNAKKLVNQLLGYGAASQVYFGYHTQNLADAGLEIEKTAVPAEDGAVTVEGRVSGVCFYGASLVYRSKTAVRFYFSAESIEGITFKVHDVEYVPVAKEGLYYIEIGNIYPQNLNEEILVQVSDGTNSLSVGYAPLDYIIRMYSKADSSQALKELVQAMHGYYLAAVAYSK